VGCQSEELALEDEAQRPQVVERAADVSERRLVAELGSAVAAVDLNEREKKSEADASHKSLLNSLPGNGRFGLLPFGA
jgi:hypothetical protein